MIALLEDYKPGCFDGKVKQFAKEHVGKPATDVWNDTKKKEISAGRLRPQPSTCR